MNQPKVPAREGRHLVFWLLRRLKRVRVQGSSMEPTLQAGQTVLMEAWRRAPQPGDLAVAEHPGRPGFLLIKRVSHQVPGGWILLGDNPTQSSDSRSLGPFPNERLIGRVVCTFL